MLAPFAYLDSVSRTLRNDRLHARVFDTVVPSFNNTLNSILSTLSVKNVVPETCADFVTDCHKPRETKRSLQACMTDDAHKQIYKELSEHWKGKDDKFHMARLISIQSYGASRWKTVLPCDDACELADDDYIIAARMNLGVAPCSTMPSHCGFCKNHIGYGGVNSLHALSCVHLKGGEVTQRHDAVQNELQKWCTNAHIWTIKHQNTFRYVSRPLSSDPSIPNSSDVVEMLYDRRKVDLTTGMGAGILDLDVCLPHPTCWTYYKKAAVQEFYAANLANRRKENKHDTEQMLASLTPALLLRRSHIPFRSFVVETYGGVHHSARWFMRQVALRAGSHHVAFSRRDVIYGVRGGVAVAVQRGNARIIKASNVQAASLNANYVHSGSQVHSQPSVSTHRSSSSSSMSVSARSRSKSRSNARPVRARSVPATVNCLPAVVMSVSVPHVVSVSVPAAVAVTSVTSTSSVVPLSARSVLSVSELRGASGDDVLMSCVSSSSPCLLSPSLLHELTVSVAVPSTCDDVGRGHTEQRIAQMMDDEHVSESEDVYVDADAAVAMSHVIRIVDGDDDDERKEEEKTSEHTVVASSQSYDMRRRVSLNVHLADLGMHYTDDVVVNHHVHDVDTHYEH
jgi:hypothetical protein